MPDDPFLPDDPRARDSRLMQYMLEARELAGAYANMDSHPAVIVALHNADRRDLELAAGYAIAQLHYRSLVDQAEAKGLTSEQTDALWREWLLPPSDDPIYATPGDPEET